VEGSEHGWLHHCSLSVALAPTLNFVRKTREKKEQRVGVRRVTIYGESGSE